MSEETTKLMNAAEPVLVGDAAAGIQLMNAPASAKPPKAPQPKEPVKTKPQSLSEPAKQESIVNDDPKLLEQMEVGDVSHQGDLILVRIHALPEGAQEIFERQLAIGDTAGSRHVMTRGLIYDAPAKEKAKALKQATGKEVGEQFLGPVFVSPQDPSASDLTHPEHGNQGFPAGAVIQVVHQRVWTPPPRELGRGFASLSKVKEQIGGMNETEAVTLIEKSVHFPSGWKAATKGMTAAQMIAFFESAEGQRVAD